MFNIVSVFLPCVSSNYPEINNRPEHWATGMCYLRGSHCFIGTEDEIKLNQM